MVQRRTQAQRKLGVLATVAISSALGAAQPAGAAVTIGQTANANQSTCGSDTSRVQVAVSSGNSYIAPSSGVIVQWRYPTFATANQPRPRLKVYDPVGNPATATSWFLRSHSALKPVPPLNTPNVYPESPGIPIQAGDHLGMSGVGFGGISNTSCISMGTTMVDLHRHNATAGGGDPSPPGVNYTIADDATFIRLAIAADIEPDADGDLFGDETQDLCSTDPTTQGPCQANLSLTKVATPEPAAVGSDLAYTITVTNGSAGTAAASVVVNDTLPAGTTFGSSAASQGSCSGTATVTCSLGTIPASGSATVTIVVTPTAAGTVQNTATVTSATPDPVAANNQATATSTVNAAGGDGGGGDGGVGTDATAPIGSLDGKGKQDIDKLSLTVGSNEAGTASGQASVSVPGGKKPVTSKTAIADVPASGTAKLSFKFKKKSLKKIKKAIAKGKKPKAKITIELTDTALNKTTLNKTVKLKD